MTDNTESEPLRATTASPAVRFIRDYLAICKKHQYIVSKSRLEFCEPSNELDDEVALAVRALVESGDSLAGMEAECAALLARRTYLPSYALDAVVRLLGGAKCRALVSPEEVEWYFSEPDRCL
ncbi:hypothetical protein E1N52_27070 [Paraburkholderia guartelaensis]|uniref:Uncharacterized protein n=1 Tax=Paraburkholderia guartelaensis TaxID=2546446 RepID=A0A4V2ZVH1_9BURK|nr:hypothetical protein [Paraburkholderia guartelaensis]TDG05099.1 hypothetical protein E1N52_27070 [Paraburkholderia guartelaensis]